MSSVHVLSSEISMLCPELAKIAAVNPPYLAKRLTDCDDGG